MMTLRKMKQEQRCSVNPAVSLEEQPWLFHRRFFQTWLIRAHHHHRHRAVTWNSYSSIRMSNGCPRLHQVIRHPMLSSLTTTTTTIPFQIWIVCATALLSTLLDIIRFYLTLNFTAATPAIIFRTVWPTLNSRKHGVFARQ